MRPFAIYMLRVIPFFALVCSSLFSPPLEAADGTRCQHCHALACRATILNASPIMQTMANLNLGKLKENPIVQDILKKYPKLFKLPGMGLFENWQSPREGHRNQKLAEFSGAGGTVQISTPSGDAPEDHLLVSNLTPPGLSASDYSLWKYRMGQIREHREDLLLRPWQEYFHSQHPWTTSLSVNIPADGTFASSFLQMVGSAEKKIVPYEDLSASAQDLIVLHLKGVPAKELLELIPPGDTLSWILGEMNETLEWDLKISPDQQEAYFVSRNGIRIVKGPGRERDIHFVFSASGNLEIFILQRMNQESYHTRQALELAAKETLLGGKFERTVHEETGTVQYRLHHLVVNGQTRDFLDNLVDLISKLP